MSDAVFAAPAATVCAGCGTQLPAALLSCPGCHRLTHAERLKELSAEAQRLEGEGRFDEAVERWRAALLLLPPDAGQHATVAARIEGLAGRAQKAQADEARRSALARGGAVAGTAALVLWKFKFVAVFVLTKAKLLLVGLTKLPTLLSMLLAIGVYFTLWGWKFALGFVLSIYVHEMGHVWALRRRGIPASAPMFVPGLGAFVLLKQHPATPAEDADVGLAGPEWGLGAALACAAVFWMGGGAFWGALARTGAYINLFNLLPFWQLDGGRAFNALARNQRWFAAAGLMAAFIVVKDGLLVILALVAAVQAFSGGAQRGDRQALARYLFLVACLSLLLLLDVRV